MPKRYNQLDSFRGRRPTFENIEVSDMPFHRSKGLEADYTILLDVSEGDYGVPSRIGGDELLNLVIPRPETHPYAEERRLFYVALTRASRGVFLLANARQPSRYIRELSGVARDDIRFEALDGKALHQCPSCLVGQNGREANKNGQDLFRVQSVPRLQIHEQFRHRLSASGTEPRARSERTMRPVDLYCGHIASRRRSASK